MMYVVIKNNWTLKLGIFVSYMSIIELIVLGSFKIIPDLPVRIRKT